MNDRYLETIVEEIRGVLSCDAAAGDTLFDLGADSLSIVELWTRLEQRFDVAINISLMTSGTVADIASSMRDGYSRGADA